MTRPENNSSTSPADEKFDGDGLPLPDEETIKAWRAEALLALPDPNDWADLVMCLRWAAELDRRGVANPKLPEAMTAIEQALRVIISFLGRRSSLPIDDVAPLLRLQAAIIDLANGRASPLFKPVKRRAGNPGRGVNYALVQGWAARALSELIEGGDDLIESARRVAKAVRAGRADVKEVTHEKVMNWRERIMQGPGPGASEEAIAHYKEPLPHGLGNTPKKRGENLLKILKDRAKNIG